MLEVINTICNIFTAIGTVGAVIVALWLSYKDGQPKLNVWATIGLIMPDNSAHIWFTCTNMGKQPIICTGFTLTPNRLKRISLHLAPHPSTILKQLSTNQLPCPLPYSAKVDLHVSLKMLNGTEIKDYLSRYR